MGTKVEFEWKKDIFHENYRQSNAPFVGNLEKAKKQKMSKELQQKNAEKYQFVLSFILKIRIPIYRLANKLKIATNPQLTSHFIATNSY